MGEVTVTVAYTSPYIPHPIPHRIYLDPMPQPTQPNLITSSPCLHVFHVFTFPCAHVLHVFHVFMYSRFHVPMYYMYSCIHSFQVGEEGLNPGTIERVFSLTRREDYGVNERDANGHKGNSIYFFGIIDILQEYNTAKKAEVR